MLYGAIIGDIVGSRFERNKTYTKDFELFTFDCKFTDDSVLTCAVYEATRNIIKQKLSDVDAVNEYVRQMQKWGRNHIGAGFGASFRQWIALDNPQPYGSFGNGSAMRVSPIGWMFNSLEEVEHYATLSAIVSHNHPEGIKGAIATAGAIFLARQGKTKAEVLDYIASLGYTYENCEYYIFLNQFDVSCQGTIPRVMAILNESNSFTDVIRTAISIGGDTDTNACIAGSIAEALYGIPEEMKQDCDKYFDTLVREIVKEANGG